MAPGRFFRIAFWQDGEKGWLYLSNYLKLLPGDPAIPGMWIHNTAPLPNGANHHGVFQCRLGRWQGDAPLMGSRRASACDRTSLDEFDVTFIEAMPDDPPPCD